MEYGLNCAIIATGDDPTFTLTDKPSVMSKECIFMEIQHNLQQQLCNQSDKNKKNHNQKLDLYTSNNMDNQQEIHIK